MTPLFFPPAALNAVFEKSKKKRRISAALFYASLHSFDR